MFGQKNGWVRLDPMDEFGYNLNAPQTLNQYSNYITSPQKMGQFYSFTFGMDVFSRDFIFGDLLFPLFI